MNPTNDQTPETQDLNQSLVSALNALCAQITNVNNDTIAIREENSQDVKPMITSHHNQITFLTNQNSYVQSTLPQIFNKMDEHFDTIKYILNGANNISNRLDQQDGRMNDISNYGDNYRNHVQSQLDSLSNTQFQNSQNQESLHHFDKRMESLQNLVESKIEGIKSEFASREVALRTEIMNELQLMQTRSDLNHYSNKGELGGQIKRFWDQMEKNITMRDSRTGAFQKNNGNLKPDRFESWSNENQDQQQQPYHGDAGGLGPDGRHFGGQQRNHNEGNFF
jgi:chromosome segregation ATPase